jgi:hypothetical protein
MIDVRALDDEAELSDLPPLDGVEGDDDEEASDEVGTDRGADDPPSGSLDDDPAGEDGVVDGADATSTVAWMMAAGDDVPLDLADCRDAENLALGDDALVAFVVEDGAAGDDDAPARSPAQEDVISEAPSVPTGSDGGQDGPLSSDDLIRELDLPPLDADDGGDAAD